MSAAPTFKTKDAAEIIFVSFNFAALSTTLNDPVVTISVKKGADDNAAAMLDDDPQIDGYRVVQKIKGGIDGNIYHIRCQADAPDGARYVLAANLPIREA